MTATAHVFIATSLDGYIARSNGDIGWLIEHDDPGEDHGYETFIADMTVTLVPVLIGEGLPLFGTLPKDLGLELVSNRSFPSGLVQSSYRVLP